LTTFNTLALFALQQGGTGFPIAIVIQIVALGAIFWFLLIRPQRRMQQQHREMVSALKKGDEVMTEGGVIGIIVHITEDRLTIRTGDTKIVVARGKVARLIVAPDAESKAGAARS
jgi:preprotein translocase subunit YajC